MLLLAYGRLIISARTARFLDRLSQRPKAQRYRGVSFKKEYEPQTTFQKLKKAVQPKGARKRAPSMIHGMQFLALQFSQYQFCLFSAG